MRIMRFYSLRVLRLMFAVFWTCTDNKPKRESAGMGQSATTAVIDWLAKALPPDPCSLWGVQAKYEQATLPILLQCNYFC